MYSSRQGLCLTLLPTRYFLRPAAPEVSYDPDPDRPGRYDRQTRPRLRPRNRDGAEYSGHPRPPAVLADLGDGDVSAKSEEDPCRCLAGSVGEESAAGVGRFALRQAQ